MNFFRRAGMALTVVLCALSGAAQAQVLTMATVERAPFVMVENGDVTGFSIDLMRAIGDGIDRKVEFVLQDDFPTMFAAIKAGQVDGAIANISITSEREQDLDFSQPIFDGGLQIMVPIGDSGAGNILAALLRWELAAFLALAFVFLLVGGMLMWVFERRRQGYFDRPAKEALFPSFWWALNLVVNGGFEERVAQSRAGRAFSVFLVVASLFVVSIFVAQITTMMTVQAITGSIQNINDLDGRRVATTRGSTASAFLDQRGIPHQRLPDLDSVIALFEAGRLDAVVFDSPILAYYAQTSGAGTARMVGQILQPESYGIALADGSPLVEPINRAILVLRENGTYEDIRRKWFGSSE